MYQFERAMHVYLTSVQMMTTAELHATGLTEEDRRTLLTQNYPMQQDGMLKEGHAKFFYKEKVINNQIAVETCFKHAPDLETNDLISNISLAAHEANHSLRQDLHSSGSKNFYKKGGHVVFAASTAYAVFSPNVEFDYVNLGKFAIAGAVLGVGAYQAIKKTVVFNDEKMAYRHTGAMYQMFNPNGRSLDDIKKNKEKAEAKTSFLSTVTDCLIMGYPSSKKRDLYMLQGREMVAKNHAQFSSQRVTEIMDQTTQNIKNRAFNIYHV